VALRDVAGLAGYLAASALLAATPVRAASPPPRLASAFTSHLVWDGDNGRTIEGLHLPQQAVYGIARGRPQRPVLVEGNGRCLSDAALSPSGDLLAYRRGWGNNCLQHEVVLAEVDGRTIGRFPDAVDHRWSFEGKYLALQYAHYDSKWGPVGDSVGIWRRSDRTLRVYPLRPEDLRWRSPDTLYLGYRDHVVALDVVRGRSSPTYRSGADVSPDGLYSIRRMDRFPGGFSLVEEATGFQVSGCVLRAVGFDFERSSDPGVSEPFWVRAPNARHLLCVSTRGGYTSPPQQSGCTTGVVDPRTLELVQSFPGKAVAPASDGRAVVVLRADTLALVELGPWKPEREPGARVRVRVEVRTWGGWGKDQGRPIGTWVYEVGRGDWLPTHTMFVTCDKFFHVTKILSAESIAIRFPAGHFTARGDSAEVTPAPTTFRTASVDGGYDVTLSVVR
jgi:hypothetical protein